MTRIVVVSDTHVPRFARRMPAALAVIAAEHPAAILHCGDFISFDAVDALEAIAPLDGVAGNNDGPEILARFGRRKVVSIEGVRIGLIHGDGILGNTQCRACAAFGNESIDAILFGHSHIPVCQRTGEQWLINPGSPTDKRRQAGFSIAVLDAERGTLEARLVFFEGSLAVRRR